MRSEHLIKVQIQKGGESAALSLFSEVATTRAGCLGSRSGTGRLSFGTYTSTLTKPRGMLLCSFLILLSTGY